MAGGPEASGGSPSSELASSDRQPEGASFLPSLNAKASLSADSLLPWIVRSNGERAALRASSFGTPFRNRTVDLLRLNQAETPRWRGLIFAWKNSKGLPPEGSSLALATLCPYSANRVVLPWPFHGFRAMIKGERFYFG
jgi:hypothetical protein